VERRRLGSLEVSVVGLGANNFGTTYARNIDVDGTRAVIDAALDEGVNFIDTAAVYGDSELFLGEVLVGRRDDVLIATKFGTGGGGGASDVRASAERSLQRLRTDRIDLLQLHTPDPNTPIAETLGALDELVREGKVREIGCSNFTVEMLDEAAEVSASEGIARFASVQNELSLLRSRAVGDVLPACERLDMAFIPYGPLTSGLLTGKYKRGETAAADTRIGSLAPEQQERSLSERTFDRVERLDEFAIAHGHSLIELAFGWLLAQPKVVSVIAGATTPEQVRANVGAATWVPTPEEAAAAAAVVAG
jgi:aryl-alcohol dehydrogenase-like predicted oxidoreductase